MLSNVELRNPALVRRAGLSALRKELGAVGTTYSIRQYNAGWGDYTAERDELLKDITLDEAIEGIRALDAQQAGEI
jgi:hypothetical protein